MAVQDQPTLEAGSVEVRDELAKKANTATRVGTLFYNLVQTMFANLGLKVDKVAGKGLSTNDFDDAAVISLGNKVEQTDIDAAITALKAAVPVAGDNLLKLHTLITDLQTLVASDDLNYDTLQEVVDFIKTLDTDGEMLAAMDAAVGNTDWRAALAAVATSGSYNDLSDQPNFEAPLGNPDVDGKVLASTVAGVRSWESAVTPSYLRQGSLNLAAPSLSADSNFEAGIGFSQPAAGEWETDFYGYDGVSINKGLSVGYNGQALFSNGSASFPSISFSSSRNNGLYFNNGSKILTIAFTGLGIYNFAANDFYPVHNNTRNLGIVNNRWKNAYFSQAVHLSHQALPTSGDIAGSGRFIANSSDGMPWWRSESGVNYDLSDGSSEKVGATITTFASTSGTFQGFSTSAYPNNSCLDAEILLVAIKTDGSVAATARRRGIFRKNSVGAWTVDFQEALISSNSLIISGASLFINGGVPGIEFETGTSGGSFKLDRYIKIKSIIA